MCFLPCPPNIVTALANGARQGVSQAGSLSVFSLPYLVLSLPWPMELGGHTATCKDAGVSGAFKTSNVNISAPRLARAFLTADLNTWQGRLQNLESI